MFRESSENKIVGGSWDQSAWTHVFAMVSGATMKVHKNGKLSVTKYDGHEPRTMTRTQHWIGRSAWDHDGFDGFIIGSIAYVKVWHGVALGQNEVTVLYQESEMGRKDKRGPYLQTQQRQQIPSNCPANTPSWPRGKGAPCGHVV